LKPTTDPSAFFGAKRTKVEKKSPPQQENLTKLAADKVKSTTTTKAEISNQKPPTSIIKESVPIVVKSTPEKTKAKVVITPEKSKHFTKSTNVTPDKAKTPKTPTTSKTLKTPTTSKTPKTPKLHLSKKESAPNIDDHDDDDDDVVVSSQSKDESFIAGLGFVLNFVELCRVRIVDSVYEILISDKTSTPKLSKEQMRERYAKFAQRAGPQALGCKDIPQVCCYYDYFV
jgi:hypothetical protein